MTEKTKGLIFLWLSILLFSSINAIIEKLGQLGANYPIHGHNPISFCNILFAGNLIAGLVFIIGYRKKWRIKEFKKIKLNEWGALTLVTFCASILGPIFYFLAIMTTAVINVVLISTTEIAWALILGYFLLGEKPSKFTLIGTFLAVIGVAVTFILYVPEMMQPEMKMTMANLGTGWLGQLVAKVSKIGEIFAFLGAFFTILGDILTNKYIHNFPKHIYSAYRTTVGAIFFFIVATSLFGLGHFADLFSPFLWEWMLFYGGVILALGIFTFSNAIQSVTPQNIAIANAFFPVSGIFFAYLIVGEIPTSAQIIGGVVILIGIGVGLYGGLKKPKKVKEPLIGFKGI